MEKRERKDAIVKITVDIKPTGMKSRVKPYQKVHEFPVAHKDLPLKLSVFSAITELVKAKLVEEMEED